MIVRLPMFLLLTMTAAAICSAQIGVSPPIVFMGQQNRFGSMTVENGTDVQQEVTIRFRFGYPCTDSLGSLSMRYDDSVSAAAYSCADWIKVFPKKFMLGARQRQTIRLTVAAPQGLADRVYWTRCVTTAQPREERVDTVRQGVSTKISFIFEQITTIAYVSGAPASAMELSGRGIAVDSQSIHVLWYAGLGGTAPYFGTATTRIFDGLGGEVAKTTETLAIYTSMMKRSTVAKGLLQPGTYTVQVELEPRRNDIPPEQIPPSPEVSTRFTITVP